MQPTKKQIEALIEAKTECGKSYDQLADELHMSKSQIQRYINGNVKSAPSSIWADICFAVGLDPVGIGMLEQPEQPEQSDLQAALEAMERRHQAEIDRLTELHEASIETYEKQLENKDKWIKRLFTIAVALVVFIIAVFFVDIANPNVGWFRDHLQDFFASARANPKNMI